MGAVIRLNMNPELSDAIALFRRDQEHALEYIHGRLQVPVPRTSLDWATYGRNQIASVASILATDGVRLCVHGIGIEIAHPEFHIDFDYGPTGQCDCFDEWRLSLHRHLRLGLPNPVSGPRPLEAWLQDAMIAGELIPVAETYSMMYNPLSRSQWNSSS